MTGRPDGGTRCAPLGITGARRRSPWGSATAIPELLGEEPDGRPVAELWFGAHPDAPSRTADGRTLDELIAADPAAVLGPAVLDRFGPRLPYLLKVLAAERTLSIQAHPGPEQARAGFAKEEAAGIPRDAPERNYRDDNHKPELLCALTPFDALCGFRPAEETLRILQRLALPELADLAARLRGPDPLRTAVTAVLQHPDPGRLGASLAARAAGEPEGPLRGVALAAQDHPGDAGVVLALLLNHVRLQPGEAIYLGAGNVHAYLRGTGVEVMANSDNVLRGGLTSKHVDVPELLAVADFTPLADPRLPAIDGTYNVAVRDFRLMALTVDGPRPLNERGPLIALCVEGRVTVNEQTIRPGHAVFVPADTDAVTLDGDGRAFVAGARA